MVQWQPAVARYLLARLRAPFSARRSDSQRPHHTHTCAHATPAIGRCRRKRIEELQREKNAAEHESQARSALLATMSHEIRTPLTGVVGNLELLTLVSQSFTAEQQGLLATSLRCADSLVGIINDILEFRWVGGYARRSGGAGPQARSSLGERGRVCTTVRSRGSRSGGTPTRAPPAPRRALPDPPLPPQQAGGGARHHDADPVRAPRHRRRRGCDGLCVGAAERAVVDSGDRPSSGARRAGRSHAPPSRAAEPVQ